jgi:hypothetical protein
MAGALAAPRGVNVPRLERTVAGAATSALLLVAIGTVFFGERLTPSETTGVVMAACAVLLLGRVT